MMRLTKIAGFALGLLAIESSAYFISITDTAQNLTSKVNQDYVITRLNLDGPYSDGTDGYTFIKVRRSNGHSFDVFTTLAKGQFRLGGIDIAREKVFAFETCLSGTVRLIKRIVVFSMVDGSQTLMGPRGKFQYGAFSDGGTRCLLVYRDIYVINMSNNSYKQMPADIHPENANPPPTEKDRGGGYNLTGRYMKFIWMRGHEGELVIRNRKGEEIDRIEVK